MGSAAERVSKVLQWGELIGVYQLKFGDKEVKVFVACVNMGLGANLHQALKVVIVHVHKDTVKAAKYLLDNGHECFGKGHLWLWWKQLLIINVVLNPAHE